VTSLPLLETLRRLEMELHQPRVRESRESLGAYLHPAFREFGRSGHVFTRDDVLQEFQAKRMPYEVWSQDYQMELLAEDCALLTYRTAHVGEQDLLEQHTNRASLWQLADGRWQLRFHQGTPAQAFDRKAG
jgi:hypothetical protein